MSILAYLFMTTHFGKLWIYMLVRSSKQAYISTVVCTWQTTCSVPEAEAVNFKEDKWPPSKKCNHSRGLYWNIVGCNLRKLLSHKDSTRWFSTKAKCFQSFWVLVRKEFHGDNNHYIGCLKTWQFWRILNTEIEVSSNENTHRNSIEEEAAFIWL